MRQASRYSIGGRPTVRVKRSKNAERDSAAVFASWATVHERASWPCICRIAGASRASANPRSSPGGASSPGVDRSASMSSTSTRRVSTRSRPDLRSLASSPTSRTSTESRSTPRTCTSAGSSDTSNAESGESKTNQPPSNRTSGRPPRVPWRTSPVCAASPSGRCARAHRLEARHGEARRRRQEHEVARLERDGFGGRRRRDDSGPRARRRSSAGRSPSSGHPSDRRR